MGIASVSNADFDAPSRASAVQGREVDDMIPAHEVSTDVLSLPIPDGFQDLFVHCRWSGDLL